jgi:transcriptional regulator with XRE-family HTH domain
MEPAQLLLRYPGKTLPWLRRQLRLSKQAFAAWLGVPAAAVARWEQGASRIPWVLHLRLVPLLERYLATNEGKAFVQTLGEGEEGTTA